MDSVGNTVSYCCIWKSGRVLYTYSVGNQEIDNLAALCLEMIPPYHLWYFETIGNNTFGFLMDDDFVYFAIVCMSLGNSQFLRFLEKLRDEFTRVGKRACTSNFASLNSLCLQEQLLPVVRHLVALLEHVSENETLWFAPLSSPDEAELAPSPCNNANGYIECGASTTAPLLGKPSKQDKKKMDVVIATRDIETEEHRRSTDRGLRIGSRPLDPSDLGTSASSLQKDYNSSRSKSSSQNLQKKWCRQVRIVLAIDAAVCLVLFVIWLVICNGIECIR